MRYGREVGTQHSTAGCYYKAVDHTSDYRQGSCHDTLPVLDQMCAGQQGKSLCQLTFGSSCIYKQYIEPEQAEKTHNNQYDICKCSSGMNAQTFFVSFVSTLNISATSYLSCLPFENLNTIKLRIPVIMNNITDNAPLIP